MDVKKNKKIMNYIPIITLCLLFFLIGVANPKFLTLYNMKTLFMKVSILATLATGITYVLLIGSIDLSVGGIVSCSAVLVAVLLPSMGYFAYCIALLFGILIGLINGVLVAKGKVPSFIVTLGTSSICLSIAYVTSGGKPISIPKELCYYRNFIINETLGLPNIIIIAFVIILIAWFILRFTVFGKYIYCMGNGELATLFSGVNVELIRIKVFVINGIYSSIGGILLFARMASGTPSIGDNYLMPAIAAAVVGGTSLTGGSGGVMGAIIGAVVITLINNGMSVIGINPFIQDVMLGIILIIFVAINLDRKKIPVLK